MTALAAVTVLAVAGPAMAHGSDDGATDNAKATHGHDTDHQHGGDEGHLDPVHTDNLELVSKLGLSNVEEGGIADVSVKGDYAYLAAWGTMLVVDSVRGEGAATFARILGVIVGLLGLLAGLILLVRPGESVVTAALVLGFWWVLTGVMQLARGISMSEGRTWNVLLGVLGLVAGIVILAQPDIGLVTLVWIVGFGLILQGMIEIAAGWGIRRLHKEGLA